MKIISIISLIIFVHLYAQAQEFAPAVNNPYGIVMLSDPATTLQLRFADMDNDDDLDAVHFGLLSDTFIVSLQRNLSTTTENEAPLGSRPAFGVPTLNPFNLPDSLGLPELADVDQDGDLDLFIFQGESGISFFENIACAPENISLIEEICDGETVQVGNIDFSTSGIYEITLINADGCDSIITLNLGVITINANVTASDMVLYAEESNADTYQWIDCGTDMDITGETNMSFVPAQSGNYRLRISKDGCEKESDCIFVTVSATATIAASTISLYPNPVDQELILSGIYPTDIGKMVIYNSLGEVAKTIIKPSSKIDVSELPNGTYSLLFHTGSTSYFARIIIY